MFFCRPPLCEQSSLLVTSFRSCLEPPPHTLSENHKDRFRAKQSPFQFNYPRKSERLKLSSQSEPLEFFTCPWWACQISPHFFSSSKINGWLRPGKFIWWDDWHTRCRLQTFFLRFLLLVSRTRWGSWCIFGNSNQKALLHFYTCTWRIFDSLGLVDDRLPHIIIRDLIIRFPQFSFVAH